MVKVKRIAPGSSKTVELKVFSMLACLKCEGIKDAQLIINDPTDEDNAWDATVEERTMETVTVLLTDPNGDETRYIGPTDEWEGAMLNEHD